MKRKSWEVFMWYAILLLSISFVAWCYHRLALKTKRAIRSDYRHDGIIPFEYISEDFMLLPNWWLKHLLKGMANEGRALIYATAEGTQFLHPKEKTRQIKSGDFWVKTQ
jgi:hypothetical protein